MNYSCMFEDFKESTGARQPSVAVNMGVWGVLWSEVIKTSTWKRAFFSSTTINSSVAFESLPVWNIEMARNTAEMVKELQAFLGTNVKETADILNISRPMIYHYQKGMEPAPENKRRLALLSSVMDEWKSFDATLIQSCLKIRQPEGKTLLEYLNEKEVDVVAVREIMRRATAPDRKMREILAKNIIAGESPHQRRDISYERHADGKPVFVADKSSPSKIVQVLPDGTHVRGKLVNRKFVPDGE